MIVFSCCQVSVARGHPRSAAASYKTALPKVEFNEEEYHRGLNLHSADFVMLSVEQLISALQKAINSTDGIRR